MSKMIAQSAAAVVMVKLKLLNVGVEADVECR